MQRQCSQREPVTSTLTPVTALQYFSESTLEYLANLDQAPDPTVRKDTFATDIFSAYDLLFNHWLQSREAKVPLLRCVGSCGLPLLAAHSHPHGVLVCSQGLSLSP